MVNWDSLLLICSENKYSEGFLMGIWVNTYFWGWAAEGRYTGVNGGLSAASTTNSQGRWRLGVQDGKWFLLHRSWGGYSSSSGRFHMMSNAWQGHCSQN